MSSDGSPSIRGLERGIEVLRLLHTHEGTALRALHAATGLPKPTLLRILHTLERGGLARRSMFDGQWRRAVVWAPPHTATVADQQLAEIAAPKLVALQRRVLWPSDLLVYRDFAMVLAESSRRLSGLAMNPRYHVGYRVDLFLSAPGRAWLAFCTEAEREAVMAHFRDHPPANPRSAAVFRHELGAILEHTRRQGYAVRDALFGGAEEDVSMFDDGLDAIAVPVPTATRVHAAINLVWPRRYDLRAKVVEANLGELIATAAAIGQAFDAAQTG
ncbi:MAG: helix-turn-helix domain-containing protein [Gammaproteobacteria bacterium]